MDYKHCVLFCLVDRSALFAIGRSIPQREHTTIHQTPLDRVNNHVFSVDDKTLSIIGNSVYQYTTQEVQADLYTVLYIIVKIVMEKIASLLRE